MKELKILILLLINVLYMNGILISQEWTAGDNITLNVSSYALVESNYAPVNMNLETNVAGQPVQSVSNSDVFIRVSSITPGGTDRELTARIASGTVPVGTTLTLVSADCTTTNSGGELGTALTTPIQLSSVDQLLVQFIETCYTGTGYNDGYRMTFTWSLVDPSSNYSLISSTNNNIIVMFTLTAHDGN